MKTITWNDYHNEYHPYYTLAGRALSRLDIIENTPHNQPDHNINNSIRNILKKLSFLANEEVTGSSLNPYRTY